MKKLPRIKVCGIKTPEEVALLKRYPVQYLGLIFAKSKRQVSIETAKELRAMIGSEIQVVGVFMNQPLEFILEAIKTCDLDLIQLHGDEDETIIRQIPLPVWKSLAIKGEESLKRLSDYPSAKGLVLDTYHEGQSGGTGKVFNWHMIKNLRLEGQDLILAGGLSGDNAIEAIESTPADVLDFNSGLEVDLMKNSTKVADLFECLEVYKVEKK